MYTSSHRLDLLHNSSKLKLWKHYSQYEKKHPNGFRAEVKPKSKTLKSNRKTLSTETSSYNKLLNSPIQQLYFHLLCDDVPPERNYPPPCCYKGKKIPANPCRPVKHKDRAYQYRALSAIMICVVALATYYNYGLFTEKKCHPKKCYEYEYMLRRTKRFPWGEGVKSFFHNEEVNKLPGDCGPREDDDDDDNEED